MKKGKICPFCKSICKEIEAFKNNKVTYCFNCGGQFYKDEKILPETPTLISEENFFTIIFNAYKEVNNRKRLSSAIKKEIKRKFEKVNIYYQEIAETYAEQLYEECCEAKEMKLKNYLLK